MLILTIKVCLPIGTFTCVYTSGSIKHTASKKLDIALLPEIQAMSDPQFPDCSDGKTPAVKIVIECRISDDNENYTVTWNPKVLGLTESGPGKHISLPFLLSQCKHNQHKQ